MDGFNFLNDMMKYNLEALNGELEKLDAKLEYHEDKATFDSANHQYQRLLFEKKLKLETLCKLRLIYAERESQGQQKTSVVVPQDGLSPVPSIAKSTTESASHPVAVLSSPKSSNHSSSPQTHTEQAASQAAKLAIQKSVLEALVPLHSAAIKAEASAKRPREETDSAEPAAEAKDFVPLQVAMVSQDARSIEKKADEDEAQEVQAPSGTADKRGPQQSVSALDGGAATKKRRLPDLQVESYNECKKEVGLIMKHFADKKIVLVSKVDGSDITVDKYKAIKEQVAAGSQVANLIEGKMVSFVVAVDRRNGEFTEKGVFVPEYRVSSE